MGRSAISCIEGTLVSILVFVELALDVYTSEVILSILNWVSILVFVELALDEQLFFVLFLI